MNEWIFFVIVVGISVAMISYVANKILDRPLKDIIWDRINAFLS